MSSSLPTQHQQKGENMINLNGITIAIEDGTNEYSGLSENKSKSRMSEAEARALTEMVKEAYKSMMRGRSFNRVLNGVDVLETSANSLVARLTIAEEHVNDAGMLHGGLSAALVDILTATSVRLRNPEMPIVSIDLSISHLSSAYLGDKIILEAICIKAGKKIAFTEACFKRQSDGVIILKARQQLAILQQKSSKSSKTASKESESQTVGECECFRNLRKSDTSLSKMQQIFASISNKKNFEKIAKNVNVVKAESPVLVVEFTLTDEHLNNAGTMHGGFTAALIDIVTSKAVEMTENCSKLSLDISISYLLPAKLGEEIVLEAKCLKIGGMMAFTEATFMRKRDRTIIAKGKHNISLLRQSN